MKKRTTFSILILLAALAAGCYSGAEADGSSPARESNRELAPDFTLPRLWGEPVTLSEVAAGNKLVLLNFWAAWCGPCRIELPHLDALYKKYRGQGFVVIAVNMDEEAIDAENFLEKNEFAYPVVRDTAFKAARRYRVNSLPTNVFINEHMEIVGVLRGYTPLIEREITRLLKLVQEEE